jgi:hypothetical protein
MLFALTLTLSRLGRGSFIKYYLFNYLSIL